MSYDSNILTDCIGSLDRYPFWGPFWMDEEKALIVYVNNNGDLAVASTTNKGVSWSTDETVTGTMNGLSVWFSRETPGLESDDLHIAWLDSVSHTCYYNTYDFDTGFGTLRTVDSSLTVDSVVRNNRIAITVTLSENIIIALSTQTELECYRSTDNGENWTDRADPYEVAVDSYHLLLFPANTGDDDDAAAIFLDGGNTELSVKMYDDSANTWTETSIMTMADDFAHINFDGSIRHSDKHLILAAHSDDDTATNDLQTWDITLNSISSPTITAKANVFTNLDNSGQTDVFIDQQTDDIYVGYIYGGTWQDTVNIKTYKSTDGMANWGSGPSANYDADDYRAISSGRTVGDNGGQYVIVWQNDDTDNLMMSDSYSVQIDAVAGVTGSNVLNFGMNF